MMPGDNLDVLAIYGSLLMAGLAGSLHCIGMCGPIVAGFAQVFNRATLTVNNQPIDNQSTQKFLPTAARFPLLLDFTCYHTGRIWTYAMLGFAAGWLGQAARHHSSYLGWQQPLGIVICGLIILSGVILLGVLPIGKMDALLAGCGVDRLTKQNWLTKLTHSHGWVARLLLGVVMGLLPCGMVYAVLIVAAALPTPLHSAAGMVVFGLGTVPSLTSVLVAHRVLPRKLRANGTRLVAVVIILAGAWMMIRTLTASSHVRHHCVRNISSDQSFKGNRNSRGHFRTDDVLGMNLGCLSS